MMGEPDEEQDECATCGSTGYICEKCHHADGDCICTDDDRPEIVPCPDCGGSA